jgi:uncharacterized damage-inducible protein DinB
MTMNDRELYVERRKVELPKFRSVLAALPKDKIAYKPHERSPSAAQIMWTLAKEHTALNDMVRKGSADWVDDAPRGYDEMVSIFERSWHDLGDGVAKLDDAGWTKKGRILMGGKAVGEQPIGSFLWSFLFDAVHHRGQLSTYIRPMGGKVPAIYGPSGDAPPGTSG